MSLSSLLDKEIIIQKKSTGSVSSIGAHTGRGYEDWISDVNARIQPLSGEERNLYDQTVSKVTHKIYIEPIANSDIVATTCRIKYGTNYYNISAVRNIDEQDRLITLECEKED